ncbi:MAG: hypothetical protein AMJ79_16015 [Phycisphaerae bacterium SM23_30]|nr:MAG: hypothetical protein AMJ79_16015 [Phycisphaerae bacterium SM23_30]
MVGNGCQKESTPRLYQNPHPQPRSLAVAPFLNQSGSEYLDVMAVTDEFYTELQLVEGFTVVPVNRVLAAMNQLGLPGIFNPEDAMNVAMHLDIDGIIVGSITQYDPYPPPKVGMAVQLYVPREKNVNDALNNPVNPGMLVRQAKPFELPISPEYQPRVGLARIIDADRKDVVERIKKYAQTRTGQQRPASWRSYTTQRNYPATGRIKCPAKRNFPC